MPAVSYKYLAGEFEGERSEDIRERVMDARKLQEARFKSDRRIYSNGMMKPWHIKKYCELNIEAEALIEAAMHKFGLSARAYSRILKVSRTIADLAGRKNTDASDVAEAIQYRTLDRDFY